MENCCIEGTTECREIKELAEYLKIVSDTNRLQILCLLKRGERCVCDIHIPLGMPQNLASHHLKALRDANLVVARREGRWVHYSLNTKQIEYLTGLYQKVIQGGDHGDQGTGISCGLCQLQKA